MRSLSVALACAALLGAGAWFVHTSVLAPKDVQVAEASFPTAETFTLSTPGGSESCAVTRGDEVAEGRSELTVDPSCAQVLPGVEKARFWQEKSDGLVAFVADGIDPIVTFSVADGVAYESVKPALPVVTLDAGIAPEAE